MGYITCVTPRIYRGQWPFLLPAYGAALHQTIERCVKVAQVQTDAAARALQLFLFRRLDNYFVSPSASYTRYMFVCAGRGGVSSSWKALNAAC